MNEINEQIILDAGNKTMNPIGILYFIFFKRFPSLTNYAKTVTANCKILRGVIDVYVKKRKSGEIKSKVEGETDLLSLFLRNPDIFTDDFIIDELMDFFLAGVQTT